MADMNRRTVLKGAVLLTSFSIFADDVCAGQLAGSNVGRDELVDVLRGWLAEEKCMPAAYLTYQNLDLTNPEALENQIQNDFRTGTTLTVKGLVLSKTEAALLAQCAVLLVGPGFA